MDHAVAHALHRASSAPPRAIAAKPADAALPATSAQPTDAALPATSAQPTNAALPATSAQPADTAVPATSSELPDAALPPISAQPADAALPAVSAQPADTAVPATSHQLADAAMVQPANAASALSALATLAQPADAASARPADAALAQPADAASARPADAALAQPADAASPEDPTATLAQPAGAASTSADPATSLEGKQSAAALPDEHQSLDDSWIQSFTSRLSSLPDDPDEARDSLPGSLATSEKSRPARPTPSPAFESLRPFSAPSDTSPARRLRKRIVPSPFVAALVASVSVALVLALALANQGEEGKLATDTAGAGSAEAAASPPTPRGNAGTRGDRAGQAAAAPRGINAPHGDGIQGGPATSGKQLAPLTALDPGSPSSSASAVPQGTLSPTPPAEPRKLSSKVGHKQLDIDEKAAEFRVQLPAYVKALRRPFISTVRICVSAQGDVTSVDLVRGAGPSVDPYVLKVLRGWRYKPWVEDGVAVPFCYERKHRVP